MRPAQAEHPVFHANRSHFDIVGKLLHQRSKWFRPIISQLLHEREALGIRVWDRDSLRIRPGDDDLTVVTVLATILEIVWSIQNYEDISNPQKRIEGLADLQLKNKNTFDSGCEP